MLKFTRFGAEICGAIGIYQAANTASRWCNEQLLRTTHITWRTDDVYSAQISIGLASFADGFFRLSALACYSTIGPIIGYISRDSSTMDTFYNFKLYSKPFVKKSTLLKSLSIFAAINAIYVGCIALATSKSYLRTAPSPGNAVYNPVINYNIYDLNHIVRRLLINPVGDEYFFHLLLFSRLIPVVGAGMAHIGSSLALSFVQHNRASESRASVMQCSNVSQFISNFMDSLFFQSMYFFTGRMLYPVIHHVGCNSLYWWCEEGAMFKILEHTFVWKKYVQSTVNKCYNLPSNQITFEENHTIETLCEKWIRIFSTREVLNSSLAGSHLQLITHSHSPNLKMEANDIVHSCVQTSFHPVYDSYLTHLSPNDSVDFVFSVLNSVDKLTHCESNVDESQDSSRLSRYTQEYRVSGVSLDIRTMQQLDCSYSYVINAYPDGMSLPDMVKFVKQQVGALRNSSSKSQLISMSSQNIVSAFDQQMASIERMLQVSPSGLPLADRQENAAQTISTQSTQNAELVELIDNYYTSIAQSQLKCAELFRSRLSSAAFADSSEARLIQTQDSQYERMVTSVVLPRIPQILSTPGPSSPPGLVVSSIHMDIEHSDVHTILEAVARRSAVEFLGSTCGLTVRRFNIVQQRSSERCPQVAAIVKKWEEYFSGGKYRDDMLKQLLQRD